MQHYVRHQTEQQVHQRILSTHLFVGLAMVLHHPSNEEAISNVHALPQANGDSIHMHMSALSWSAILAGAAAAAALSLSLLLLGAGLGLSSVSPWAHKGVSAATFGFSTIVWVTVTQILAAGMGGYLAGRLRIRWAGVDADEVYFRDTAHGFLVWSVATLATAVVLAATIASIVNGGVQAAVLTERATTGAAAGDIADKAATADVANSAADSMGYFVDTLFRLPPEMAAVHYAAANLGATDASTPQADRAEVTRMFAHRPGLVTPPADDMAYISQLVARQTGLTQQAATQRLNTLYARMQTQAQQAEAAAKEAADKARKASIYATLWLFASLLMGAFSASLAATWGGRCRDA